jgi:hypothetical protein
LFQAENSPNSSGSLLRNFKFFSDDKGTLRYKTVIPDAQKKYLKNHYLVFGNEAFKDEFKGFYLFSRSYFIRKHINLNPSFLFHRIHVLLDFDSFS